jgi:hypothetical protein
MRKQSGGSVHLGSLDQVSQLGNGPLAGSLFEETRLGEIQATWAIKNTV